MSVCILLNIFTKSYNARSRIYTRSIKTGGCRLRITLLLAIGYSVALFQSFASLLDERFANCYYIRVGSVYPQGEKQAKQKRKKKDEGREKGIEREKREREGRSNAREIYIQRMSRVASSLARARGGLGLEKVG